MIYFDNAATSGKKPPTVINAVNKALKEYSVNPGRSGHTLSQKAANEVYNVREKVALFFGADGGEQVIFTLNCTHALNFVIKGVLRAGDHVIVSDMEHNAVMRPLYKWGITYESAEVDLEDDGKTVENFKNLIRKNTKMIICTAASNVLGKTTPIAEIGNICKERNILFCVDAAQLAGVKKINMGIMNIDYLCVAAHKGLYAPMGIGMLIARKPIQNTVLEGGTGTESLNIRQPEILPEMLESGTVNLPGVLGVGAGIDFVNKIGIESIYNHEFSMAKLLSDRLSRNKNIKLYTHNFKRELYVPVVSFNVGDINSEKTAEFLNKNGIAVRAGLHCAPTAHKKIGTTEQGTVRISPSVFNNQNEIYYLIRVLEDKKLYKM